MKENTNLGKDKDLNYLPLNEYSPPVPNTKELAIIICNVYSNGEDSQATC